MNELHLTKNIKFGAIKATKHYWTEQYDDFERGLLIVSCKYNLPIKDYSLECEICYNFHKENNNLIPDIDLSFEDPLEGYIFFNHGYNRNEVKLFDKNNKRIFPSNIIELNNDSLKQILETAKDGDGI